MFQKNTFDHIKIWIENIKEHAMSDVEIMILGNKCDLNEMRQVINHTVSPMLSSERVAYNHRL